MTYTEKICPFLRQADFECFCVEEYKDEDDENEDNNTASSSNAKATTFTKEKQTARKNESNHAPKSYSINIEVSEEYI